MPSRLRKRLPWGSLRIRLTAWNTAVALTMTVAALLAARYAARATLYQAADAELRGGVREVAMAIDDLFPDMDAVVAEMRRRAASQERRGWFSHLLTEEGRTLWKSGHCPDEVAATRPFNLDRAENVVQVGRYRYVRLRISAPGHAAFHVRVGTYTTGLDASLNALLRVLTVVGLVLCGLTPLTGWWLAVRATQPVHDILETADRLKPTLLADRLPVRGVGDELDHLAGTINSLLDDVASHVERQEEFVADAAHELRGPLASLRSVIEAALNRDGDPEEYREALETVLDETRYLVKLANNLLLLTESAGAHPPMALTPVDLTEIVRPVVAMFAGAAEERGIVIDTMQPEERARVAADPGHVRQVVGNLLDNAIRFTPRGGRVRVGVDREPGDDWVVLTVGDSGVGIAPEHLPRLFDRFFKVDPARSRTAEEGRSGGLGLPICKAIVERLGGMIAVSSRAGAGTIVTVRLPAADAPATTGAKRRTVPESPPSAVRAAT